MMTFSKKPPSHSKQKNPTSALLRGMIKTGYLTKKTKPSSQRWLLRHMNDPYVYQAEKQGWRCRSVFKLQQLDERFRLFRPHMRILDLGCSPGGWCQYSLYRLESFMKKNASKSSANDSTNAKDPHIMDHAAEINHIENGTGIHNATISVSQLNPRADCSAFAPSLVAASQQDFPDSLAHHDQNPQEDDARECGENNLGRSNHHTNHHTSHRHDRSQGADLHEPGHSFQGISDGALLDFFTESAEMARHPDVFSPDQPSNAPDFSLEYASGEAPGMEPLAHADGNLNSSEYLTAMSTAMVVGVDLKMMDPMTGLSFIQGDVQNEDVQQKMGEDFHMILSDMAPELSGHGSTDRLKMESLMQEIWFITQKKLRLRGHLVFKAFHSTFIQTLKPYFSAIHYVKPKASRADSREIYVVALGYKGF